MIAREKQLGGRFDFLKLALPFSILSAALTAGSLVLMGTRGFNYGIDFAGGTEVQVQFNTDVEPSRLRSFTESLDLKKANVQAMDTGKEFLIRIETLVGASEKETSELNAKMLAGLTEGLKSSFSAEAPEIRRVDSVGPQVGSELKRNGILATFYSLLIILIYVGLRFDYKFAPGAVFCIFHDAVVTLGIYSLLGWEVNLQTLAAVLTIIGYSLNDTIVTFDRVRENLGIPGLRDLTFDKLMNRSVNDTLARTILTNLTVFFSIVAMVFFADGVIRDFSVTMLIGVILGTYSTIYVAAPLVLLADKIQGAKAA